MVSKPKEVTVSPEKNQGGSNLSDDLPNWLVFSLILVAIITIFILGLYFSQFNGPWGSQDRFAQFGDFIGGTLNPILGFATVGLLVWSIRIQLKELKETREELKATKNETARSADALLAQVRLASQDFKLREITRAINEQVQRYDELISNTIINSNQYVSCLRSLSPHTLSLKELLNGIWHDHPLNSEQLIRFQTVSQSDYIDKSSEVPWEDCVSIVIIIGALSIEYEHYSSSIGDDKLSIVSLINFQNNYRRSKKLKFFINDENLDSVIDLASKYINIKP
ncbi:hypothetical protein HNW13_002400 [Shewanella sp. BF02_Schw]|jgi:hypothetical protein|uniref:hypothetical protein n=1 Tax=Shewanella sp. BF02_Schw TaxID=394908 RepID=UPI00177ACDD6|nr:hypothetical protein [Shewanella sp. BF02_Schw]MBO1894642.1 hypothetical protein [Shewanella sp. BF02_Schw]